MYCCVSASFSLFGITLIYSLQKDKTEELVNPVPFDFTHLHYVVYNSYFIFSYNTITRIENQLIAANTSIPLDNVL